MRKPVLSAEFMVDIVAYDGDVVAKSMGPFTQRHAEKVDGGANINLNHERFYTVIRRAREDEIRGLAKEGP